MKKSLNKIIGLLLTVCIALSSVNITVFAEETSSKTDSRQEDLDYLYDNLKDIHPDLFANTPEEEFLLLKDEIENNIPQESNIDFVFDLEKLAALVGDSHTGVSLDSSIANEIHLYPVEIEWFDGNWYLTMTKGSDTGMIGMQVTAINGIEMSDVLKKISTYISHDNEVKLQRQFTEMCYIADLYYYAGVATEGEPLVLSLTNSQGIKRTLSVSPIMESEVDNYRYASLDIKRREVPDTEYDSTKNYFSKALNNNTYYIQYNRCAEDSDYPMNDFCEEVRDDIDKGNYKLILVDLRNNGGGSDGVITQMMYLLKNQMDTNDTQVAVLIGESTFSAAIINAVEFQEMGCVLAGEVTSGSVNHFGAITIFNLPNSQFKVSVSSTFIDLSDYFDAAAGKGVEPLVPDVVIPQTIDDYSAGKDTCVEKILNDPSCLKISEHDNVPLTRGRFIGMIYESLGSPKTEITSIPYSDLFGIEWYLPALNWAKENNIASGEENGSFYAPRDITWEEAAIFMVRAVNSYGINSNKVRESQVPDYLITDELSREYVEKAWQWGIIPENADFTKTPTRADGKEMLDAFINIYRY